MLEKINYEELIDPLCIPVIKYMREELGIDTQYCCQGMVKGEVKDPPHSLSGYICALYSPATVETFRKIYKLELHRFPHLLRKGKEAKLRVFGEKSKRDKEIAVYLPVRRWESKKKLKEEWDLILETIKDSQA